MSAITQYKSPDYKQKVQQQINTERERQQTLTSRASQLERQVRQLIDESVALLRLRMAELGIETDTPDDLMAKARELSLLHRDLTLRSVELQHHVQYLEREGQNLMTWMQKNQDLPNGINRKPVNGVKTRVLPIVFLPKKTILFVCFAFRN